MGAPSDPADTPRPAPQRARRVMAVVDVVESVRLMAAHEDDVIERWRSFVMAVRTELMPLWAGRIVKSLGDGLLLEFPDETRALHASLAMLERIEPLNLDHPREEWLQLRVGLHGADVVQDELDVYGSGVNLAARLAGLAGPGQIVLSRSAYRVLQAQGGLADAPVFEDLGPCYLKHLDAPVHAYRTQRAQVFDTAAAKSQPRNIDTASPPTGEPDGVTLAVLAFAPASSAEDDRVIAELLADALIARLALSGSLRVISRWSTLAIDATSASGSSVWTSLRAHYAVRGRVHRVAGRLVVGVELLDTSNEGVIWAGRQSFRIDDVLTADDEVSLALAKDIASHVASDRLGRARTSALPSLDGNQLQFSAASLMHREDLEGFSRAHAMLDHLIDRYPRQPSPRAWAAMWYVLQVTRGFEHDPQRVAGRALDHVNRALDNDPDCALALAMGGFVQCHLRRDLAAAESALARSVALNPSESWAWLFRSVVAAHRGDGESAWAWASRASALSPLDPQRHYFDGLRSSAAVASGRWSEAITLAHRALAVNRDHLPTLRGLAIAQVAVGDLDGAREAGRQILRADPSFTLSDYLAAAPPEGRGIRQRYVEALRQAGLPAG